MKFTEKRIREAIRKEVSLTIASNLEKAIRTIAKEGGRS